MKYCLFCLCFALLPATSLQASPTTTSPDKPGWIIMPAGARPAYMGIHGGTMPVSLLVSSDGSMLVTFVGRTGNDFLEVLRRTDVRVPSLLNATMASTRPLNAEGLPAANGTRLMAGSPTSSLPVISLTGEGLARIAGSSEQLLPFGFSHKPISIEGQVVRPLHLSPVKNFRLFFQPHYLQPRRGQN